MSAQNFSHIQLAPFPAALSSSTPLAAIVPGNIPFGILNLFPLSAMAPKKDEFWERQRNPSDFLRGWEDAVEFSGTPFTQQVRLPLGSLFGGRIRLGGFNAVISREHIQRGLPGGGSLDAWAPIPMGHAGMILPKDDNQYGLCLTFHLAGSTADASIAKWAGPASRLAALSFW